MADDIVSRLRIKDSVYTEFWQQQLMDEAADKIERLRKWKAEATEVILNWEAVWEAAGKPGVLGQSKSLGLLGELGRLDDEIKRLRAALSLAVGELSTHGNHRHETPDMLRDQFIEEARRG